MEREPLLASQVFQDEEIQFIPSERRNTGLTRSTSAPAKPIMGDFRNIDQTLAVKSKYESNSIVRRALLLLIIYLLVGVAIYIFDKENFSVGSYGGKAFNTIQGRLFASLWLLVSTLSVARVFLYLAEIRVDKRHRRMEKWILHRQMTVDDLVAADINNNGFISKAEFAIYKLKEMGLIKQKDILLVCNQFDKIDRNNSGKITISDLLQ
ncbi:two pore potassium channel c-like isoform X2 [Papaver somniferum]|uniref:two pore potassium channel c-like isoform X2 n=1 Tax=Papaver somniferum TaxID=3469 RepID=UPI000E6F8DAF|nr:two pore potassium channel c-like isoform X2 [Papaver somniferum]